MITGWYDELARRMAMNGFVVFGHDHRGHGRSEGKRAYIEK
jgi:alpha-beta hydrolase superfamily lysophospholipase